MIQIILTSLLSYLLGSVCSAILVCRIMGFPDPRTQGSKNPGATNVKRVAGNGPAMLTLVCDGLKGIVAVGAAHLLFPGNTLLLSVALVSVVVGHVFPLYFQFKGGKGVATSIGAFLTVYWPFGCLVLLTWLTGIVVIRNAAMGAVAAFIVAPMLAAWFLDRTSFWAVLIVCILGIWAHRMNVRWILDDCKK